MQGLRLRIRGPGITVPGSSSGFRMANWVLVKGFNLSYHKYIILLCTIDPDYGNLKLNSLARTQLRV